MVWWEHSICCVLSLEFIAPDQDGVLEVGPSSSWACPHLQWRQGLGSLVNSCCSWFPHLHMQLFHKQLIEFLKPTQYLQIMITQPNFKRCNDIFDGSPVFSHGCFLLAHTTHWADEAYEAALSCFEGLGPGADCAVGASSTGAKTPRSFAGRRAKARMGP